MAAYCPYCMTRLAAPGQLCPKCGKDPASYHPSSHHFPMGSLLQNRYLIGRALGEGGFGITYLGLDTTLERRVAVKEYFPNIFVYRESSVSLNVTCYAGEKQTLYEKGRAQFLQEARVMARFDGLPEIVQVLDFFPANNTAYIVMELLTGTTLQTLVNRQGRIPANQLFSMLEPVLRAMNRMHGAGIIHRDISPDNLMLLDNGQIKLLDFGCARDIVKEHTMTVMLKHGYAPIEQYTGYNQGPWTDIYALCATCYHCLTGQTPPKSLDRMAAQDPLVPPNQLGAALTMEQEQALLRGLAAEPKERWQSIAGLYDALYGKAIPGFPWMQEKQESKQEMRRKTVPVLSPEAEAGEKQDLKSQLKPEPEPAPKKPEISNSGPVKKKKGPWIGIAAGCMAGLIAVGAFAALHGNSSKEPPAAPPSDVATQQDSSSTTGRAEGPVKLAVAGRNASIAAGHSHTVALKIDGTVVATGNNEYTQCCVEDWTDIIAVAAGYRHTVGLKSDGTMVAVGDNGHSQCAVEHAKNVVGIAAGDFHTVALKADGTVNAAGSNGYGQCDVEGWSDIVAVAAGLKHTVGLKSDGTVVAVGHNDSGQCDVSSWTDIKAIFAHSSLTVGLKSDGTVVATGDESKCAAVTGWTNIVEIAGNSFRAVGLKSDGTVVTDDDENNFYYAHVANWSDIVAIAVGDSQIVGVKSDGTAVAAGAETHVDVANWREVAAVSAGPLHTVGLKSDGTVTVAAFRKNESCDVESWSDITMVSAGNSHTVGLKSDGTVTAVGDVYQGKCNVTGWADIVAVSAADSHTVGLKSDGAAVAVGGNDYGQCEVDGWTDVVAVSAGTDHTVGVKSDGTVVAVGDNDEGQCNVEGWTNIVSVDAALSHTVGLKTDGTVVGTGYEVRFNGIDNWTDIVAVSAGDYYTVGLKSDGTVVFVGEIENKLYNSRIAGWTDIVAVSAGNSYTVGVKSNGAVVVAGINDYGECDVNGWDHIRTTDEDV